MSVGEGFIPPGDIVAAAQYTGGINASPTSYPVNLHYKSKFSNFNRHISFATPCTMTPLW